MTRPVDPDVVRRLSDCIELLPGYINNPQKMPFVQEIVQRALEQIRFDREALARGHEVGEDLRKGKKYRYELGGDLRKAEKYRKPVTSVWLSDRDEQALKDGFEEDETGIFEFFEHWAAEIGEWIKECRCPRDAERFRTLFRSVCGEALSHPVKGIEVSPGVYKLDLSSWTADAAKPLCDYLRELADEMATEPPPDVLSGKGVPLQAVASHIRKDDPDGQKQLVKKWQNRRDAKTNPLPSPIGTEAGEFAHLQRLLFKPAELLDFLKKVEGERVVQDFNLNRVVYACLRDATPFSPCSDDNLKTR